jgi:hypothetical protein
LFILSGQQNYRDEDRTDSAWKQERIGGEWEERAEGRNGPNNICT